MRILRFLSLVMVVCTATVCGAATWTPLANTAPGGAGVMMLLSDGTVMIQNGTSQNWMRLTPDIHGSYINGVWTANPISPMNLRRLYFASHVLPDGRVWVLGGEYTGPALDANIGADAEIWNPVTNTWTVVAPYPNQVGGCGAPHRHVDGEHGGGIECPYRHLLDGAVSGWLDGDRRGDSGGHNGDVN